MNEMLVIYLRHFYFPYSWMRMKMILLRDSAREMDRLSQTMVQSSSNFKMIWLCTYHMKILVII